MSHTHPYLSTLTHNRATLICGGLLGDSLPFRRGGFRFALVRYSLWALVVSRFGPPEGISGLDVRGVGLCGRLVLGSWIALILAAGLLQRKVIGGGFRKESSSCVRVWVCASRVSTSSSLDRSFWTTTIF